MSKDTKVESNENKELYELAFHLVPTIGDDNVGEVFDEITKKVEKINGKIVSKSEPALLNLEYTMEKTVDAVKSKYNTAYFAWIIFDGGDVQELHSEIESNSNVLRHLLIKTDQSKSISAVEVASMLNGEENEENKEDVKRSEVKDKTSEEEKTKDSSLDVVKEETDEAKVDEAIDDLVK